MMDSPTRHTYMMGKVPKYIHGNIRGSSYYVAQIERPLLKHLLRGEGRSLLKYIMTVLLLDFEYFIEKKFGLSARVWVSILSVSKLLPRGRTFGAKCAKRMLPCRHFEGFSPLDFGH